MSFTTSFFFYIQNMFYCRKVIAKYSRKLAIIVKFFNIPIRIYVRN